jgi:hypothetical protein
VTRLLVAALLALGLVVPVATASAADIAVEAGIAPRPLLFGAHAVARVVVTVDGDKVDVGSIRIAAPVAPLTVLSSKTTRHGAGGLVEVVLERSVVCDSYGCLPGAKPFALQLAPVRVTARSTGDTLLHAATTWPRATVSSRLAAGDLATVEPRFRVPSDLPAPSFRVAPERLSRVLFAAGALALLAGIGLAATALWRRTRPDGELALERALRGVRAALNAEPPERRRALESLARVLDERRGLDAGDDARTLAWAAPPPAAQQMAALADEVELAEVGA